MKRRLFLIAVFALLIVLSTGAALAQSAGLKTTREFMNYLDTEGVEYSYVGMNDGLERVDIPYTFSNFKSARCAVFFRNDLRAASFRIWDIMKVSAGENYTLSALNDLNKAHRFTKFVYDGSDSTVQVEADVCIDPEHCAESVYDTMLILISTIEAEDVTSRLKSLR